MEGYFVRSFVPDGPVPETDPPFAISRDLLARMVAAHTSGMYNAIPEQADFEHADEMIALLNSRLGR